jgi:hypothetical protein
VEKIVVAPNKLPATARPKITPVATVLAGGGTSASVATGAQKVTALSKEA